MTEDFFKFSIYVIPFSVKDYQMNSNTLEQEFGIQSLWEK